MIKSTLAILIPLCLYACGNKPYPNTMQVVDTLVYNNPDSAIALLEHIEDSITSEPEATQMYYWLLTIKAKDKAYVVHSSDSLILKALHYYEDKEDEKHLPEAYYYAGRVYSDLGDAPQALDYYQKAAELLEESTNYRLKEVLYSQMGDLFFFQDVYDKAMKAYKKSYYYDKVYTKDKEGIVVNLCNIGSVFNFSNNTDSAMFYYQKANQIAKESGKKRLIDKAQSSLIDLFTQLKQYDSARIALQTLSVSEPHTQIAYNSIVADLFLQTENLDSAKYYYEKLLKINDVYAQQGAHWGLAEIAQKHFDCQSTLKHISLYNMWTDSIRKITDSETIRKAQSLYNYQLREKENLQLKMNNALQRQLINYSILAILILILYFAAHLQYSKRKKLQLTMKLEKLEKLKEEQYRKSSQFIEENNQKIEELERALQESDSHNDDMQRLLQEQKERIILLNSHIVTDIKAQSLEDYSSTIKISIEEVDANEVIKNTISSTNDFATNFSFDKTLGKTLKLGAQFGASTKNSKTVSFEKTTTLGNDELGEIVVNFGDIVLADTTNTIREWSSHYQRPNRLLTYPNFSSQYYTGWYRLYIAPGPIN